MTVPLPVDLARPVHEVAPELLGCELVHVKGGRRTAGRIVEVEAYGGQARDDCSHAHRYKTARNRTMYGPPGRLYIYFTYGMHYCSNVVAHAAGEAGAILLRALEPTAGLDLMARRRGVADPRLLCAGPARLVKAMGFGRTDDGRRLDAGHLHLVAGPAPRRIVTGPRVGVKGHDAGRPWRFCDADSGYLSRPVG
ncbi:MAG: DNA-3-methyladenine glycosylase [Acidimicrobiia bacterium]|nr:DNA-3-methyladenine glycosylase [Acidimicrobiia bacterium]